MRCKKCVFLKTTSFRIGMRLSGYSNREIDLNLSILLPCLSPMRESLKINYMVTFYWLL